MYCDLHMHSTASDGTDAPETLAKQARSAGLAAIALTDHDTTAGLMACAAACEEEGLAFISGIELSASPIDLPSKRADGKTGSLHLLGYHIDPDHPDLLTIQEHLIQAREDRNPEIIANLNKLGVNISYDQVLELANAQNAASIGRPHIAQVLIQNGYVKTIHEAFAQYIGEGAAAYARKDLLTAEQAIATVHAAGGLAVLAHPVQLRRASAVDLEADIAYLVRLGLDGIETQHSDHQPADVEHLNQLVERHDLIATGGSDYHGDRKSIPLNNCRVSFDVFQKLRDAKRATNQG